MAHENEHIKPTAGPALLLTRLREYKEFIGVLVFFVAGILWIYGFFATKENLRVVECIASHQIALIESEMKIEFLNDRLAKRRLQLKDILKAEKVDKSNEEMMNSNGLVPETMDGMRLDSEITLLWEDLKEARDKKNYSFYFLKANKCASQ